MSHLEYQTPFHPGPFASQQQNQHQQQQQQQQHHTQAQQQQGHQQQQQQQQQQPYTTHSPNPHQFNAPGGVSASAAAASISASPSVSSTPHQAQAFAPAPSYPGHNLSRPPPPQFHDGLMQHQPNNYSPAGSFPAGQQNPYTSAPFAQSMTATSATPPPQQQQQQQQQAIRHSASPQQLNSPYAGPQHQFQQPGQPQLQQQQQTPKQNTPPTRYPMAAPPLPQTPNVVQQAGAAAAGSPQAPQSPNTQAREQKRVDLLLEINIELLQEINNLQAQGRGGAMNPQHQVQLRQLNLPDSMAAEEYIQCLRRVQANLAYLAPRADTQQAAKAPPGPAHMTPPAHMPQLQPRYDQLRELFPGWVSNDMRMAQNAASPRTHQMNNSMNGMNSQTAQA